MVFAALVTTCLKLFRTGSKRENVEFNQGQCLDLSERSN